jgi:hypothetical protein
MDVWMDVCVCVYVYVCARVDVWMCESVCECACVSARAFVSAANTRGHRTEALHQKTSTLR